MSARIIGYDTLMNTEAVAQADTHYTSSIKMDRFTGEVGVFIVSTAGSITVTQQCSIDGTNWYNPVNASGTALGTVCTALTVTTGKYVSYSPVMAPYARFKVLENNSAATDVTLKLVFNEEA